MAEYTTKSVQQTQQLAEKLGGLLKKGDIIAYTGGMGMGKTAFTRGVAKGLGIDENEVCSPTFALVNEYRGENFTLCHFDMYRVADVNDLYSTGFFDYLETDAVLAIEWSENIAGALPPGTIYINIERISENERKITIKGDNRFENIGY
ncbi:MAG TPA: tRNA (adenosine(37)-N6)-threonylcarbamoyltransferase complex ATPase subunit type 1 TsaE [Ruminococcaceae bacterium]|nr:tRNA (adenosine(37)-N6)-threonylcarbamoyltransferase complex ATPase subunit type 1 TsaE [Oscillospiraceae bacterium]